MMIILALMSFNCFPLFEILMPSIYVIFKYINARNLTTSEQTSKVNVSTQVIIILITFISFPFAISKALFLLTYLKTDESKDISGWGFTKLLTKICKILCYFGP